MALDDTRGCGRHFRPSRVARVAMPSTRSPRTGSRFAGLRAASPRASAAARGASRKRDTAPELILRRLLWARGLRYRIDAVDLPGRPDIVFRSARLAVFCDGDFWHGRDLANRVRKLSGGHNAPYWVAKIVGNVARDRRTDRALASAAWRVLRFWESDIVRAPEQVVDMIVAAIGQQRPGGGARRRH
jgi:DNA mismatch endonuclease, patch repair protein